MFRPASDGRVGVGRRCRSPDVLPAGPGRLLPAAAPARGRRSEERGGPAAGAGRRATPGHAGRPVCRVDGPPCWCLADCSGDDRLRLPADATLDRTIPQ